MAITSINGTSWNNLTSINGIQKSAIVNIGGVLTPPPAPTGPYKYFVSDVVTTAGVTNTTTNTILYSNLIPANTFISGGILECLFRVDKNNSLGVFSFNIYVNNINSLSRAVLMLSTTDTNVTRYNSNLRYFSLSQGLIKYFGSPSTQSDLGVGSSSSSDLATANFDLSQDNYLIVTVQPTTANADVITGTMNFIRGYE